MQFVSASVQVDCESAPVKHVSWMVLDHSITMFNGTYSARREVAECLQKPRPLSESTRDLGPKQASNDERDLHDMNVPFKIAGRRIFDSWKREVRLVGRYGPHVVLKGVACDAHIRSSALQLLGSMRRLPRSLELQPTSSVCRRGAKGVKQNACTSGLPAARRWKVVAPGQCSEASFEKSDSYPIKNHTTG